MWKENENSIGYVRKTNNGIPIPMTFDQRFVPCARNDNHMSSIRLKIGDGETTVSAHLGGVLDHLQAHVMPDKKIEHGVARLQPEHVASLSLAGIAVEPADEAGGYRTVDPVWIDGYYAPRR